MSESSQLVSILMPVKNAAPFLRECLESIIAQTETNWELLAIDDSSDDSSLEVLKQYSSKDARIKPYQNSGSGIIDALRLAYSKASGKLITRMDADDKMAHNKLEILKRNLMSSGKKHVAIGQVKYFAETELGAGYLRYEKWLNTLTATGSNYSDIYKECVIPSPCWMVFREDLDKCHAFHPGVYPEDYDLCFRFYQERLKVIPCNEVLHYWRDHPNRSSRTDDNYSDNRFLELKVNKFLDIDFDRSKRLVIWGAGKKGKTIARLLRERDTSFDWVCNNPNKIGKEVYGTIMKPTTELDSISAAQVLIAVANPEEQHLIKRSIKQEAYWFC